MRLPGAVAVLLAASRGTALNVLAVPYHQIDDDDAWYRYRRHATNAAMQDIFQIQLIWKIDL